MNKTEEELHLIDLREDIIHRIYYLTGDILDKIRCVGYLYNGRSVEYWVRLKLYTEKLYKLYNNDDPILYQLHKNEWDFE